MFHVRQRSTLNGFYYHVLTVDDQPIAELEWPSFAQAKNARFRVHPKDSPLGDVHIRMVPGRAALAHYRIGFEYLNHEWRRNVRFTLYQGDKLLALAEAVFPHQRFRRARVEVLSPLSATLVRHRIMGRLNCCWERDGRTLGTIEEPSWFSMRRELAVNLPSTIALHVQIFMAFLVINDAFR